MVNIFSADIRIEPGLKSVIRFSKEILLEIIEEEGLVDRVDEAI